jgi:ATP-binding cassette subfamily B protein
VIFRSAPNGGYSDIALFARLLREAKSYWLHILALFVLGLASTPIALLQPLPVKIIVDSVLGDHPLPGPIEFVLPDAAVDSRSRLLIAAVVLIVVVAVLNQLRAVAMSVLRMYTGQQLVLGFRARLFRHAQRLSLAFHDLRGSSDSFYRIQADAPAIQHLVINTVIPFISAATTFAVVFYVVIRLNWQLAAVALAVAPVLTTIAYVRRRRVRPRYRDAAALDTAAQAVLHEVLGSLRVVKAFGQEDREGQRYLDRSTESLSARRELALTEGVFGAASAMVTAMGTAAVLFVGVRNVQSGELTLGELLLVVAYLGQLYRPLNVLSTSGATKQASLASAERAFRLLDEAPDVVERPHARHLVRARGAVSFQDVSFGYERDHFVLRHVFFEAAPGARVGLMGPTGAGKTTLMSLLVRFYDPSDGQILLDGVDLRDYKLKDLRDQFAMVLQEPLLFSASIAENIAYARPAASEAEIIAAAKAASAHEFISELPDGYQTRVGERGMRLSGGERQRVSIARAFLKDAPILLLDEPTSSVDLKTESAILEALERLMQGRTTFMIAHRTSLLKNCDLMLRLHEGTVVAEAQMAS